MFQSRRRIIQPEILDDEPYERAAASLRDLVRINRFLGGYGVLLKRLRELVNVGSRFTMLDVGAASGDMGKAVREVYPHAQVTSFDYRADHLRQADAPKVVGDAFHLPFQPRSFDFVHCSLFLHHFPDSEVVKLLGAFGSTARQAIVLSDLERHVVSYYALPLSRWLLHWDPITLHDGPISVQAAFRADELRALAKTAGLTGVDVRIHRPAFRLSLVAQGQ